MHEVLNAARALLVERADDLGIHALSEFTTRADGRAALTMQLEAGDARVLIEIRLPVAFPHGDIGVYIKESSWVRYEHQSADGKMCLPPDSNDDWGPDRLVRIVEDAIGWVNDAITGSLTRSGDRFELPDFPEDYEYTSRIVFDEEPADINRWRDAIGGSGALELLEIHGGWAVKSMMNGEGRTLARATTIRLPTSTRTVPGRWIRLDRFSSKGHRAPAAWSDLLELSPLVERERYLAWRASNDGFSCLLVGFPIPSVIGGPLSRVHWQPIFFLSFKQNRRARRGALRTERRRLKNDLLAPHMLRREFEKAIPPNKPIPWGYAEDISAKRLYARSLVDAPAFETPLLIGCGALGSVVAECWVRSGLRRQGLIDKEPLEHGNLCRHVLDGASVGRSKAVALAERLRRASPSVIVTVGEMALPPHTKQGAADFEKMRHATDLIVDASGDEEVLGWLDTPEGCGGCQVAAAWTNSDASIGIGILSGTGTGLGVASIRQRVVRAIADGHVPGCDADSYRGPAPIVPGVGCWHPTFAGNWARILGLGAALSEWLRDSARGQRSGRAVVLSYKKGGWHELRSWSIDPLVNAG
jgi:hypothetical protein